MVRFQDYYTWVIRSRRLYLSTLWLGLHYQSVPPVAFWHGTQYRCCASDAEGAVLLEKCLKFRAAASIAASQSSPLFPPLNDGACTHMCLHCSAYREHASLAFTYRKTTGASEQQDLPICKNTGCPVRNIGYSQLHLQNCTTQPKLHHCVW